MSTSYSDRSVFGGMAAGRGGETGCLPRRRSLIARMSDEMRSWFGDQDAIWRRRVEASTELPINGRKLDLRAQDLMTNNVVTVRPDDSIERAARLMEEFECGALPVVDDSDLLLGIITDRDITVRLVARGFSVDCAQVSDCMTDQAFACDAASPIEACIRMMSWFEVRRIPIVDDDHRVVGIVSQSDIVRHARNYLGRGERRAMTEMLCAVSE